MAKMVPFREFDLTRAMCMDCEPNEYDPTWYKGIRERRHGIEVSVLPHKKEGVVGWKWSASQQSAKRNRNGGYSFSRYPRQWQEGFVGTFEEGKRIVTDLYAQWMSERPLGAYLYQ